MTEIDPCELLSDYLQSTASGLRSDTSSDDLIARIAATSAQRPRRSGVAVAAVLAILVAGGGGLAAALVLRTGDVTTPQAGVACRDVFGLGGSVVVAPPSDDPIEECAAIWERGQLPTNTSPGAPPSVPALIACVDDNGVVNVFPLPPGESCAGVDMAALDGRPIESDPLVVLQTRLSDELNLICVPPADAPAAIQAILDHLELVDWTIEMRDDAQPCTRAGIDGTTVFVMSGPPIP